MGTRFCVHASVHISIRVSTRMSIQMAVHTHLLLRPCAHARLPITLRQPFIPRPFTCHPTDSGCSTVRSPQLLNVRSPSCLTYGPPFIPSPFTCHPTDSGCLTVRSPCCLTYGPPFIPRPFTCHRLRLSTICAFGYMCGRARTHACASNRQSTASGASTPRWPAIGVGRS